MVYEYLVSSISIRRNRCFFCVRRCAHSLWFPMTNPIMYSTARRGRICNPLTNSGSEKKTIHKAHITPNNANTFAKYVYMLRRRSIPRTMSMTSRDSTSVFSRFHVGRDRNAIRKLPRDKHVSKTRRETLLFTVEEKLINWTCGGDRKTDEARTTTIIRRSSWSLPLVSAGLWSAAQRQRIYGKWGSTHQQVIRRRTHKYRQSHPCSSR